MALRYITLNGKRYKTTERKFKANLNQARQINVTLGGKVNSQTFTFADQRWSFPILVELSPADANYGSWDNLVTAYQAAYVPFVDIFGTSQGDVIMEGTLEQMPDYALVDTTAPFVVNISLVKRQT